MDKYFQKKHALLIILNNREEKGKLITVLDIESESGITRHYAWNLLELLEKDNLVKKGKKVKVNDNEYYTYVLTKKAKQELRVISESINLSN